MKIEKNIQITNRKSLAELKRHSTERRDETKAAVRDSLNYMRGRWSPKRVASDVVKSTAIPLIVHGTFNFVKAIGGRAESIPKNSWLDLVEELVEACFHRKAEEVFEETV